MGEPAVAELADAAQLPQAVAADPDGDVAPWARACGPAVDGVELALEAVDPIVVEEGAQHAQALLEARAAAVRRHAEHRHLLLRPAHACAEDEAPAGEVVERGDQLRREHGLAVVEHQHRRAEPDRARHARDEGELGRRLEDRVVDRRARRHDAVGRVRVRRAPLAREHDVVVDPERVEAGGLGGARVAQHQVARRGDAQLWQLHPDLHLASQHAPPSGARRAVTRRTVGTRRGVVKAKARAAVRRRPHRPRGRRVRGPKSVPLAGARLGLRAVRLQRPPNRQSGRSARALRGPYAPSCVGRAPHRGPRAPLHAPGLDCPDADQWPSEHS